MTIKELRKSTGLTQSEFSRKTGIPLGTIRNWEQGSRKAPEYILSLVEKSIQYDKLKENK